MAVPPSQRGHVYHQALGHPNGPVYQIRREETIDMGADCVVIETNQAMTEDRNEPKRSKRRMNWNTRVSGVSATYQSLYPQPFIKTRARPGHPGTMPCTWIAMVYLDTAAVNNPTQAAQDLKKTVQNVLDKAMKGIARHDWYLPVHSIAFPLLGSNAGYGVETAADIIVSTITEYFSVGNNQVERIAQFSGPVVPPAVPPTLPGIYLLVPHKIAKMDKRQTQGRILTSWRLAWDKYIAPPGGPWLLRNPAPPAPPPLAPGARAPRIPAVVALIQDTNEQVARGAVPGAANALLLPASIAAMRASSTPAPPAAGVPVPPANPLEIRATHRILRPRLIGGQVDLSRSQHKTA